MYFSLEAEVEKRKETESERELFTQAIVHESE